MEPTPLARSLAEPLHEILLKAKSLVTTTPSFEPSTSNSAYQHHRVGLFHRNIDA